MPTNLTLMMEGTNRVLATLDGADRVLLSRFDFRGRIHLEEADLHAAATGR